MHILQPTPVRSSLVLSSHLGLLSNIFPSSHPAKTASALLYVPPTTNLLNPNNIWWRVRSRSFSLGNTSHPVTTFCLCPSISLTTHVVRNQDSHAHKIRTNITVLFFNLLIFTQKTGRQKTWIQRTESFHHVWSAPNFLMNVMLICYCHPQMTKFCCSVKNSLAVLILWDIFIQACSMSCVCTASTSPSACLKWHEYETEYLNDFTAEVTHMHDATYITVCVRRTGHKFQQYHK